MNLNDLPFLPDELLEIIAPEVPDNDVCFALWSDVVKELSASEFQDRSHHNVGTYDVGCRGPLCRKANREHPKRRKSESRLAARAERIYDPIIEFYHTVYKHRLLNTAVYRIKELA